MGKIVSFLVRLYFALMLASLGLYLPFLWVSFVASGKEPVLAWGLSPLIMVAIPVVSCWMSFMMVFRHEELFGGP